MSLKPDTPKPETGVAPQTIAVALDAREGAAAPLVVASGRGHLAEQILAIAFANNVKVRTDADLVQVLAAVDVDSDVPTEAMAAVSEILAYVYRANSAAQDAPPTSPAASTP
jgi:flagellar biosynthesis protein